MNTFELDKLQENRMNKNKVVLGLSGGVDSTAAALLLQEKGYEVIGLYFDVQPGNSFSSTERKGEDSVVMGCERAEIAAQQLGIKFIYKDVSCEFNRLVIDEFCREYINGRTPNPCIVCNPTVKFKTLLDVANEENAYYIATGHYADTYFDERSSIWYIKRAASEKKDQSYMLYRLSQEAISRLILPLNSTEDKEKVREIARSRKLTNAEAKDSQEICFIDDDDNYKDYLNRRGYKLPKGDFIDKKGKILGKHQGILNYTIGQRKGLGIALGKPAFVTAIDSENNRVVLGENEDLFTTEVISAANILMGIDMGGLCTMETDSARSFGIIGLDNIKAKIRYAAKPAEVAIEILEGSRILTRFKEPQRAVTPGQSIVFYQDDLVIGGGFIL